MSLSRCTEVFGSYYCKSGRSWVAFLVLHTVYTLSIHGNVLLDAYLLRGGSRFLHEEFLTADMAHDVTSAASSHSCVPTFAHSRVPYVRPYLSSPPAAPLPVWWAAGRS